MLFQKVVLILSLCLFFPYSGVKLPGQMFGKSYEQLQWSGALATGAGGYSMYYVDFDDPDQDFYALYYEGAYYAEGDLTRVVYEKMEPWEPDQPRKWRWYRYDRASTDDPWPAYPSSVGALRETGLF